MFKTLLCTGLILLILVCSLWWTRYQVVHTSVIQGAGFYRIDRLTGRVELVTTSDFATEYNEKLRPVILRQEGYKDFTPVKHFIDPLKIVPE